MAGLTANGIEIKDVDEVLSDIESAQLADISSTLNLNPDSVLGQLNGIYAAALAELWEVIEEVYQSAYPDTASGQSLSYVSALTGAIREPATYAVVQVSLIGTVGTVIPAGTQFYPPGDSASTFSTPAPYTIIERGATDWADGEGIAINIGSGPYAPEIEFMTIATPVPGLTGVLTTSFAEGQDEETDAQLRQRREQALALAGTGTVDAIRADMLTVEGVDSCTVFENPTGITDADGVPPYGIEVLVFSSAAPPYDSQDVADQIWASKPAGTETYGALSETVVDSQGDSHTMYYSEPTTVRTYIVVKVEPAVDGTYIGDQGVMDALEQWGTLNLSVGQSVYQSDIINVVADLSGVLKVYTSPLFIDDAAPATSFDLILTSRQLATIDEADVTVIS